MSMWARATGQDSESNNAYTSELGRIIQDLTDENERLRISIQVRDKQIEIKDKLLDAYRGNASHDETIAK
jgi:hypothetical protein